MARPTKTERSAEYAGLARAIDEVPGYEGYHTPGNTVPPDEVKRLIREYLAAVGATRKAYLAHLSAVRVERKLLARIAPIVPTVRGWLRVTLGDQSPLLAQYSVATIAVPVKTAETYARAAEKARATRAANPRRNRRRRRP